MNSAANGQYQLVDSGAGRKLERFGRYLLDRPCAQAVWRPQLSPEHWQCADGFFTREGGSRWELRTPAVRNGWDCALGKLHFLLRPTDFGHVGIFPEHASGWTMAEEAVTASGRPAESLEILNLFAYSGGATLAMARLGCRLCHLDASRKMVDWARENARLNHLDTAPVRWIIDDVQKFLRREIRRAHRYDAIILDPPSFGRGTNQELFQIDANMLELLSLCRQALSEQPLFVMLTCHTPGYTPIVLEHLVAQSLPAGRITTGEMLLPGSSAECLAVPCGAFAFWHA